MSTLKAVNLQHPSSSQVNLVLASDGSVSGGLPYSNRNLLYNGAMQVHQRIAVATTANFGSNYAGYLTADRWYSEVPYLLGYGTITQSVENDAPAGSGFRKSLKHTYTASDTAGSGKYMRVSQLLEGQDVQRLAKGTASARTATLSFWVKSNLVGVYVAELHDVDNSRYVSQSYSVLVANTWEYKTVTFPADASGVLDNDNAASLRLNFWLRAGSDFTSGSLNTTWGTATTSRAVGQVDLAATNGNYWQVTGVQLEAGSIPTSFEFKSFGQELRECQRYYYKRASGTREQIGHGWYYSATQLQTTIQFPVSMRTSPVVIVTTGTNYYQSEPAGGATDTFNSFTIAVPSTEVALIYNNTEAASTLNYSTTLYTNNAAANLAFSSEL